MTQLPKNATREEIEIFRRGISYGNIICKHERKTDLTNGLGEVRNIYCPDCGWHLYKGKEYTKAEWNKWINDPEGYK